jgi:N-acyl-phosphatidylethanolamine-hydrolysing phospholipase D
MDVASLGDVVTHGSRTPHLFLPLNTRQNLPNHLQQAYKVSELDWWNACLLEVEDIGSVRVTATPAQHFSGRGLFDRNASLWASWAMEGLHPVTKDPEMKVRMIEHELSSIVDTVPRQVYFGGDTGYCAVEDGEHGLNPDLPYCPACK